MVKPAFVVDIQGTIVTTGAVPVPGSLATLKEFAKHGTVVYLSAMQEYHRESLEPWLEHRGYPNGIVLLRAGGTGRESKIAHLKRLKKQGYTIICGIGDSYRDIEVYKAVGVPAFHVGGPWRFKVVKSDDGTISIEEVPLEESDFR